MSQTFSECIMGNPNFYAVLETTNAQLKSPVRHTSLAIYRNWKLRC